MELLDTEDSPDDLDYCFFKAKIYMKMGNLSEDSQKALEYYNEVVKIVPNWVTVYMIVDEFENEDVVKPNYTRKEELC